MFEPVDIEVERSLRQDLHEFQTAIDGRHANQLEIFDFQEDGDKIGLNRAKTREIILARN